jgi:Two component regulator propeller
MTLHYRKLKILLSSFLIVILSGACKERNDTYPPQIWAEYTYAEEPVKEREIQTIFYESDHSFWLGSQGKEGLLFHNGYKWTEYNKGNTGIDFDSVTCFLRDPNGILWVGWRTGLAKFDNETWQSVTELEGHCVTGLGTEGIGNLYAGIKGENFGLARFENGTWDFYSGSNAGTAGSNTNALLTDNEQYVWLATTNSGIKRGKNGIWETMTEGLPLLSQNITCMAYSGDGSIWAGTDASQLIHLTANSKTVLSTGTSKPITALAFADDQSIYCSTKGAGIVHFNGSVWNAVTSQNEAIPSDEIITLHKAEPGRMYFSVPGGKVILIKL